MKRNRFPAGWDEARVRKVIEHYEAQTEDEAVAEDEAAFQQRPNRHGCCPSDWFQKSHD
jgi:hypothetical protein